jgi:hypothetical protein
MDWMICVDKLVMTDFQIVKTMHFGDYHDLQIIRIILSEILLLIYTYKTRRVVMRALNHQYLIHYHIIINMIENVLLVHCISTCQL